MRTLRRGPAARRSGRRRRPSCWLTASLAALLFADVARADGEAVTPQMTIDQFGWLPASRKVAIFAEPVKGRNARVAYRPGPVFEVRRQSGGTVVHRGNLKPWNGGKVSDLAGDRVWYADFSDVRATRHLRARRPREPGPLVPLPDRRGRLPAGAARLGADLLLPAQRHADPGEARRPLASSRRAPRPRPGPRGALHPGRQGPRPPARSARRLVRRGRPQQVRALPGVHPLRPALGLRAEPARLRRRHQHPGERQRRPRPARRGEVGARLALEDAGHRRRGLQPGRRPPLRQRPGPPGFRHPAAVLHRHDHLGDRDRRRRFRPRRPGVRAPRSPVPRLRRPPARRRAAGLGLPRGAPQNGPGRRHRRRQDPGGDRGRQQRQRRPPVARVRRGRALQDDRRAGLQGVCRPMGAGRRRDLGQRAASPGERPPG